MNATTKMILSTAPDLASIKAKQNAAWAAGDYAKVGTTMQIVGEDLAETLDLPSGSRVLDVAAGNGNATLAFARRFCRVTSTDYIDALLARGRARAVAEGLDVAFEIADAENLPYRAEAFDAVVSTFGVMFAPDQTRAANELLRVCRPGGKIGLANWTAGSFIGQLFEAVDKATGPAADTPSPARWGERDWVASTFAEYADSIDHDRPTYIFRYPSPRYFVDFFRANYGPLNKAFLGLDPGARATLHADLLAVVDHFNTATDGTMRLPSEYSRITITMA
jgi:SAM-dependent methyltransferase